MSILEKNPINLAEFEAQARAKLSKLAYDYYASGACDELTIERNQSAFRELSLMPRMLVDVSKCDMSTTVLGQKISMPMVTAPMAFQRLAHDDGEIATARAAHAAGTIMTLSTLATTNIEQLAEAASGPKWFQLYVYKDRGVSRALVERAEAAGYSALVLTVDSPVLGRRERDVRNRFHLPTGITCANFIDAKMGQFPQNVDSSALKSYIEELFDLALTWKDLEWFVSITKLPVLVKGVLRADDAVRALEYGASGVVVSNHGGRQLDTAISGIEALPAIVEAIGDTGEVLMDGGIRRGTDVLKALALGAKAVMLGRPLLWGLAVDGERGVSSIIEMIRSEFELAMKLSGAPTLTDITEDLIAKSRWNCNH